MFFKKAKCFTSQCLNSIRNFNGPFYRYGGHIEFIRCKEHYGMPRGALAQYLRVLFGQKDNFTAYFSRKRRS